ncbi:hypothetical protein M501DRAFT_1012972 [Patellaria atrata CBS 101060]|uniref:Uncharacterized protein n=1 Tax=Patellaria atrata CBS 101060 TaxID=1346257 RepID=A0A9P4SIL7_9PEZI|nr:hypothetical protein M501DRAFT_1012972 [Patellaria atrata CBS 101060]
MSRPNTTPKFQLPTLTPIDISLTAGTSIPAPLHSPPSTPGRPPTPGCGPLSSHPTTPLEGDAKHAAKPLTGLHLTTTSPESVPLPASPTSETLASPISPTATERRPSSVRKFLSLRSLSSSDSLRSSAQQAGRPGSPATVASTGTAGARNLSRKKSGGGWFGRRKSGFFGAKIEEGSVYEGRGDGVVAAQGQVQGQGVSMQQEVKKGPPAPKLPEIGALAKFTYTHTITTPLYTPIIIYILHHSKMAILRTLKKRIAAILAAMKGNATADISEPSSTNSSAVWDDADQDEPLDVEALARLYWEKENRKSPK